VLRYRLGASVLFTWEGAQQNRLQAEGITRDISVQGAFILAPTCPPVEATVQVEVFLPSLQAAAPAVRIKAESRVLRVEHIEGDHGRIGFAILSEGFALCPTLANAPEPKTTVAKKLEDLGRKSDA
jgi:hypothetical protein